MQTSVKQIKMILYRLGEAGNFLSRLFALSDQTQFLWIQGTCNCTPNNHSLAAKLKYYWYFPEKINLWMRDAHLTPTGFHLCKTHYDYWETNPIVVSCAHYENIIIGSHGPRKTVNGVSITIPQKYFFVRTTDDLYNMLRRNVGLGVPSKLENVIKVQNEIAEIAEIDYIDLDMLIAEETFETEYHRVCTSMGLAPIDTELALSFLVNWKQYRVDKPQQK